MILFLSLDPEGWVGKETRVDYHTNERRWGEEGVPEAEIAKRVQSRVNKTPMNADCIAYIYSGLYSVANLF